MKDLLKKLFGEKCTKCHKTRTKRHDENGVLMCIPCQLDVEIQKEMKLKCPKCGTLMNKEYVEKTITDKCPKCGGVFLDKGEMFGFLHDSLVPRGA
jgi:Zn-finger nucleic acid-binding protein